MRPPPQKNYVSTNSCYFNKYILNSHSIYIQHLPTISPPSKKVIPWDLDDINIQHSSAFFSVFSSLKITIFRPLQCKHLTWSKLDIKRIPCT